MPTLAPWAALGMQTAAQAGGSIMGLITGGIERRAQLKQARKLQALQMEGQREMTDYNTQRQLDMWKATGPQGQMEQLKAAGLNPALIYGMGGAGGQTANVETGQVQGQSAPQGNYGMIGMEIGSRMAQNAAQLELIQAQADNARADAELKRKNIPKVGAETDLVLQNIQNAKAQQQYTESMNAWQQLETSFAKDTYRARQTQIDNQITQQVELIRQIGLANKWTEETWADARKTVAAKAIEAELHNELLKVQKLAAEKGIELTDQEIQKLKADIAQGWQKLHLEEVEGMRNDIRLKQSELDLFYKEMQTKFNVKHPGLWNVIGGTVEQSINDAAREIYEKLKRLKPKL